MLTPGWALTNEPLVEFFVTERRNASSISEDWPDTFAYFPHQPGNDQARALKDALPRQPQRRKSKAPPAVWLEGQEAGSVAPG